MTSVCKQRGRSSALPGMKWSIAQWRRTDCHAARDSSESDVPPGSWTGPDQSRRRLQFPSEPRRPRKGLHALGALARGARSAQSSSVVLYCPLGIEFGAGETKGHGGFLYDHIIFPLFTKNRYADKERQEQLIRQSDLDWTIVRPAPFNEAKPRSDFQVVTEIGDVVLRKVSRTEVASFVIEELETGRYRKRTLFIGHQN